MTENEQPTLFNTEPEPWQLDDQDDWIVARVVFAEAPFGPYDYSIPNELESELVPGKRVEVPLGRGNRSIKGYCLEIITAMHPLAASVNLRRLKPVSRVLDARPLLTPDLVVLSQRISEYYCCPVGSVLETIVPPGVRSDAGTREFQFLYLAESISPQELLAESAADQIAGIAGIAGIKLSPLQLQILRTLALTDQDWTISELAETVGCSVAPISTLRRKGLIVSRTRRIQQRTHAVAAERREENLSMNPQQQAAVAAINRCIESRQHETFLMHGVTGSGKTEVYIQAIQKVVEYGRQAIVLVPEISLTPQTRQRFRARFDRVAVLHSHLTAAQRAWHWRQIATGNVQVIIGARSAIFAPVPRLGLIVLDEEHDGSFKQDKAPRYHARDVACWRAQQEQIPLILGSATPSLETWQRAVEGEFTKLTLSKRVLDLPLPDVAAIDLRVDFAGGKRLGPISQKLRQEILAALKDGGQVILLLNRRGFSTRIQCPACGNVEYCPDCSIPLTHHTSGQKAVCHYCDYQIPQPDKCSECGNPAIRFSGLGTQKLEAHVSVMFPDVPIMRMDTDTMQRPDSHEKALQKFREGETKILLGTQMIAKGLDFPNVTVVGVINADTGLHLPDFRAAERTFGLITQVAGRTGRGSKGGRVLVQTFNPENPAIEAALSHDYLRFANHELPQRRSCLYPPFGFLARVVVRGELANQVEQMAERIAEEFRKAAADLKISIDVLGPAVCPIEKLRGLFRFHILFRSGQAGQLQQTFRLAEQRIINVDGIQWIIDIDPQDMI